MHVDFLVGPQFGIENQLLAEILTGHFRHRHGHPGSLRWPDFHPVFHPAPNRNGNQCEADDHRQPPIESSGGCRRLIHVDSAGGWFAGMAHESLWLKGSSTRKQLPLSAVLVTSIRPL